MSPYVKKTHWQFSCFNTYHPDTDSFKSNLTLLLEARFSNGVQLSILKNAALGSLVLLQHYHSFEALVTMLNDIKSQNTSGGT